jgi:NPCBM/NEW2 domain
MTRYSATAALLLLAPVITFGADLQTLAGKKVTGDLVSVDDKAVVIKTPAGDVRTPLADLLEINFSNAPAQLPGKYNLVELTDGTLLHCADFKIKGKELEMTVLPDLPVKVPLPSVFYVLRNAQEPKIKQQWQSILAERGKRDVFYLLKKTDQGDKLDGLDGTFGDADAQGERIEFELASTGTKRRLPIEQLQALLFANRIEGIVPQTVCRVRDTHGNQVVAQKLSLTERGLAVMTVSGPVVVLPGTERLTKLDFSKGKLAYLSDLEPVHKEQTSTEDRPEPYGRNRNLDNAPIVLEVEEAGKRHTREFAKGLTLHSRTVLVYDLNAEYKEFKAVLGIDAAVVTPSNVKVTVEGDGKELFAVEFKRADKVKPVMLDVKGVRLLRITVAPAEGEMLDDGKQLTLADALVTK